MSASSLIDFILHIDRHLAGFMADYGLLTYAILFAIVFLETGLVVTPFLPGDSLLFAAGTLTALGAGQNSALNPFALTLLLLLAAILGDTVNYWAGNFLGKRIFSRPGSIFLNPAHLEKTEKFYEKYGAKTIFLARFVPIVRTLAPFVAGAGKMNYSVFFLYNIIGALVWVNLFVWAGYFFGNLPLIKQNFSKVILAIIVVSVLPLVWEYWQAKRANKNKA